jgi:ABC-type dipeptide/oligopeptide/nickel transport system permease component
MIHHVLPNSLVPTITVLGLSFGHLIGGAFVVETIFAWPGLGRLAVQAIFDRDIPVVMGSVLVVAPLCLLLNLIVDVLHVLLDPRLRHEAL